MTPARVVFRAEALDDLKEIAVHIAASDRLPPIASSAALTGAFFARSQCCPAQDG